MTNSRSEPSIGARIKATRRERGFRTTKDLADAMPGSKITPAILENIESGRKGDIDVSQLLNIARALCVPPSFLLAPLGTPDAQLDLPNLSSAFAAMTAAEFDSWLAAIPGSSYRSTSTAERLDIDQLNAYRELRSRQRALSRLETVRQIELDGTDPELSSAAATTARQIIATTDEISELTRYLESAGWQLEPDTPSNPSD
jgi:transcriptional regulator with XRE-family HTH domain